MFPYLIFIKKMKVALTLNYLFQYADPTDEPNSAPYDQTFEDYDLQVSEWKGEE